MKFAETASFRSTCLRAHCGAVIVKDDTIISIGYNGSPRGLKNCCDVGECPRENSQPEQDKNLCHAIHGELNSIINLARTGGIS